ncbi:hypothetical protein [Mycolicibacter longobardus]|uniref:Uncharacterized protein n=1 Tax=Mycolicibacter longobardus TaxID=1108812 RepID=A0A1X1YKP5_9MYCO|nr:hypothetical protein [Mycolicibacter longobardus]MCV7383990.1 hypothetical protein [Mycolicibacter longobardus]ORW11583.1 hypothetical protein AWC16_10900 [Mycolicibacter longobardus]
MKTSPEFSPWITSGIAVAAVGAIAVTPIQAPLPAALSGTHVGDVQLASWADVINTATANFEDIWDHWSPAPAPLATQALLNQAGFLQDLFTGAKTFDEVLALIAANLTAAGDAALVPYMPAGAEDFIYTSLDTTPSTIGIDVFGFDLFDIPLPGKAALLDILINGLHYEVGICPLCVEGTIPVLSLLVGSETAAEIQPYLGFLGSPLSGVLWGLIGANLGPLLQLNDDLGPIIANLSGPTPDWEAALQGLLNIPENFTNALLNGYGEVSLAELLSLFDIDVPDLNTSIDFYLGGLLSPGGSLLNGLGFSTELGDCGIACATFDVPMTAVGPLASMIGLAQAMAEAIGWDGQAFDGLPMI